MRVVVSKADGLEEVGKVVAVSADGTKLHVLPDDLETTGLLGAHTGNTITAVLGTLHLCAASTTCPMCKNGARGEACKVSSSLTYPGYVKSFLPFDVCDVSCDAQWLETLISDNRNNDLPCFLSAALQLHWYIQPPLSTPQTGI
jgi:hypothetical protein